jgi:flagellar hook-length control protein FliK
MPAVTPPKVEEVIARAPRDAATPLLPESVPLAASVPTVPATVVTPAVFETNEVVAPVETEQPQIAPLAANSPPAEPTPAAAPRSAPSAPAVAAQLSDAFVTHARVIENGGTTEFQLRLDPPDLGEVKVRVLATGDRIEARLVVSDDAVKRLIESQLPELRQRLEAAGVSVPKFDVTTGGGDANTGGRWERPDAAPAPPLRTAIPPRQTPRPVPSGGLIDVTA